MYCGNNKNNPDVVQGYKVIGHRYDCFKKGIGIGLNLPFDRSYGATYSPIRNSRIYCGKKRVPKGRKYGSPVECLRKGVGVGKMLKNKK